MYQKNLHIPVLLNEVMSFVPSQAHTAFDATLGGGGHTVSLLKKGLLVTSADLDSSALELVQHSLPLELKKNWLPRHGSFVQVLKEELDNSLDFILADLGFSSNQLEAGQRGLSYQTETDLLDLRYDIHSGQPAWKKLYYVQKDELAKILYNYSGEALSRRIAESIIQAKKETSALTVGDVVKAVQSAIPQKFKHKTNGILSRVWQALRIWTNDELVLLSKLLEIIPQKLAPGGRAAIISFHSLEDKQVTKTFRTLSAPHHIDEYGNTQRDFMLLTPKAVTPTEQEVLDNVRSRSALLRVLEKVHA